MTQQLLCEDLETKKTGFKVISVDFESKEVFNMVIWREDYGHCAQHSSKVRFYIIEGDE